jgi:hypothetical protein
VKTTCHEEREQLTGSQEVVNKEVRRYDGRNMSPTTMETKVPFPVRSLLACGLWELCSLSKPYFLHQKQEVIMTTCKELLWCFSEAIVFIFKTSFRFLGNSHR